MFARVLVILALVASVVTGKAVPRLFSEKESHQHFMWREFVKTFAKTYSSPAIESMRMGYFLNNLKLADERNQRELEKGGSAVHGITKFFDNSEKEFKKYFLGAIKPEEANVTSSVDMKVAAPTGRKLQADTAVNWAGVLTTPVKNQGYCGSCWAFSAIEQVESDSMRTLGTDFILSPEQVVQCAPIAQGCDGGWTSVAYGYIKAAGGLETDADYPYSSYLGVTGQCSVEASKEVVTVTGFTKIPDETDMANYVLSTGPLSVCVDANNWSTYTSGILSVCGTQVDHCVQAVGVDTGASPYWIVRNSWGTDWGVNGYIYLAYGQDTCAIASDATYTTVKLV